MQCIHVSVCVFMHQSWSPNACVVCVYVCIHASGMIAQCNVFTCVCVCVYASVMIAQCMYCVYISHDRIMQCIHVFVCVYALVMIAQCMYDMCFVSMYKPQCNVFTCVRTCVYYASVMIAYCVYCMCICNYTSVMIAWCIYTVCVHGVSQVHTPDDILSLSWSKLLRCRIWF